jgi:ATP-dependent DNA helicase RecG
VRSFAGDSELTEAELRAAPIHPPRPSRLEAPLTSLAGVGPKLAEAAMEAGISTVGDLLMRVPHDHRDRTVVPVADLKAGDGGTVRVEVLGNTPRPFRRGRGLSIT